MKCATCKRPSKHFCKQCKKRTFCSAACQKQDWDAIHALFCVPIGVKTTRDQDKIRTDQAESEFVRLLAAYRRTGGDDTMIARLEEFYGNMSLEAQQRYANDVPCHNSETPIALERVADLEPTDRIYLFDNNIKYCYSLDALVHYLHTNRGPVAIHPTNRQPFTEEEYARIREASELRVLELWNKYRATNSIEQLLELEEKLQSTYGVSSETVDTQRMNKGRQLLDESYFDRNALLNVLPSLVDFYGLKLKDFDQSRMDEQIIERLKQLVEDKIASNPVEAIDITIFSENPDVSEDDWVISTEEFHTNVRNQTITLTNKDLAKFASMDDLITSLNNVSITTRRGTPLEFDNAYASVDLGDEYSFDEPYHAESISSNLSVGEMLEGALYNFADRPNGMDQDDLFQRLKKGTIDPLAVRISYWLDEMVDEDSDIWNVF